jgi:hypothetical protein
MSIQGCQGISFPFLEALAHIQHVQDETIKNLIYVHFFANVSIRALSPALAVKFNISPGRWQHFPLWPLFLQRQKGKRTEMTGTQHVGTLKT